MEANVGVMLGRPGNAFAIAVASLARGEQPADFHKSDALTWLARRYQEALACPDSAVPPARRTLLCWHQAVCRNLDAFARSGRIEQTARDQADELLAMSGEAFAEAARPVAQGLLE